MRVSAWLPHWDQERATASLLANADLVDEVMPFWYEVAGSGQVVALDGAEDAEVVDAIRSVGALMVPTVFSRAGLVGRVDDLVDLVDAHGYDGIEVDFEGLAADDRPAFSVFVAELGALLHEREKLLSVAVYAKTAEPGTWAGPQAQDYRAIGDVADRVRVMGYDFHWQTSPPGPIGPLPWLDEVVAFAVGVIPASKLDLGVHLYGYDWVGQAGETVTWEDVRDRAATRSWAADAAESWLSYDADGGTHTVWYGDRRSVAARVDLALKYRLGGVAFWRLGGEDPEVWDAVGGRGRGRR